MQKAVPASVQSRHVKVDAGLVAAFSEAISGGRLAEVCQRAEELHSADLAYLLGSLPRDEAELLFDELPAGVCAETLADLDETFRRELLEDAPSERISRLVQELETDDAADVLAQVDEETADKILPTLADADAIRRLLAYAPDSAGGIMASELVCVPPDWTVAEATEAVRDNAETVEEIFVLFVIDQERRLLGFVSLKRLLLSRSDARVGDVMRKDVHYVFANQDQEDAVRIMERYDLVSLAVVDRQLRLLGRITIDDAMDVMRDEAEEDYLRLSGISGDVEQTDKIGRTMRGRLPWLLAGMFGAALAGAVIGVFEEEIRRVSILAAFIPVVMAMAGNAGIQSSAIMIQGLASGNLWSVNVMRRLGKEVVVALLNGLALAAALWLIVVVLFAWGPSIGIIPPTQEPLRLALTASCALFVVVLLAGAIGTMVPLILVRLGIDPALATGPFITTSNDIVGLIVFFVLAMALYLPFV